MCLCASFLRSEVREGVAVLSVAFTPSVSGEPREERRVKDGETEGGERSPPDGQCLPVSTIRPRRTLPAPARWSA